MVLINDENGATISNVTINRTNVLAGESVTVGFRINVASNASNGAVSGLVDMGVGKALPGSFSGATVFEKTGNSIAKGASKAFSFTFIMPTMYEGQLVDPLSRINPMGLFITAQNPYGFYVLEIREALTYISYRANPVFGTPDVTFEDVHAKNPKAHFGAYVQGHSLPRLTAHVTLDPLFPNLTANYSLVLKSGGATIFSAINNTGIFEPGVISASGTIDWTYTVTDSAGMTATRSGSLNVIPYTAPSITTFRAVRYKQVTGDGGVVSYVDADDGENVRFTIAANVMALSGGNPWSLAIKYGLPSGAVTTITPRTGTNGQAIALTDDRTILATVIPASSDYEFTAVLTDYLSNASLFTLVPKAGGYMNVEEFGTAVGMRSTGTPANPLFESAYDARFYKGARFDKAPVFGEPKATRDALGIQTGIIATTLPNNGTRTGTVTFPIPYTAGVIPNIQLTLGRIVGSYDRPMKLVVTALSNTEFTWSLTYASSSNNACDVHWLAIGDLA